MNIRLVALAIALGGILTSCGPSFVTYDQLGLCHKGMAKEKVDGILPMEPTKSFDVESNGKRYSVYYYPLMTAQSTSTSAGYSSFGGAGFGAGGFGSGGFSPTTTTTIHTNRVYFLYLDKKLRYWGMMGDFSKSEDLEIIDLAPEMYKLANPDAN